MTRLIDGQVNLDEMVHIPAGEYLFGAYEPQDPDDEHWGVQPRHVVVPSFWMDRTPVTYAQYGEFLKDTEHMPAIRNQRRAVEQKFLPYLWTINRTFTPELHNVPVTFVTWYDALAYAEWAGKALPTEIEWEWAARGASGTRFPWGDDPRVSLFCNGPADYDQETAHPLTPVDAFPQGASPFGCLDMMGNAWEWCWNLYYEPYLASGEHGEVLHRRRPAREPYWELRAAGRAQRGGSSAYPVTSVAQRGPSDPWHCSPLVGFRCIWYPDMELSLEPPPA